MTNRVVRERFSVRTRPVHVGGASAEGYDVVGAGNVRGARPDYASTVGIVRGQTMGWLRALVGVVLVAAPGAPMRLAGNDEPSAASLLLMRTIGIRDLVIGLGTVAAAGAGAVDDERRWISAAMASDTLDTVVSLASLRSIGKRDALAAAGLALVFVCGDLEARRHASDRSPTLT